MHFTGKAHWEFEHWGKNQRYYVEHIREGLDSPGEWYLDREKGILSYYPMPGESIDKAEVIAPAMNHVLVLSGDSENDRYVEHLHFRGISFRHADHLLAQEGLSNEQAAHSVHAAVQADAARFCSLISCEVTQSATYGIWFRRDCENIRIERCHVHHLGAGGVRVGDTSDSTTQRIVVHNNRIHDGGLMYPAAVGMWIGRSSYNIVSNNEISDFFYTGISVGWSWGYASSSAHNNIIEYNLVHDLGKGVLSDMGGIYLLGLAPGTIVRNNVFHDIESYAYGGWG
ncbi:MAG: right-handed parallel beta-helix repeat-containing protein, partial [Proteobacteria bacterium]|nr:right-handed parallel beta-helix repeat-containing protein [Pseudomonadota bacterium]